MQDKHQLDETERREGKALWAAATRAFAQPAPVAAGPDNLTLAAYLDARLDERQRDEVEGQAAASPETLELLLAADAALGAQAVPSERLLARAAALVPGERFSRPGLLTRMLGGGVRREAFRLRPVGLAAALSMVLLVSVVGFELGRFGYAAAAETFFPETDGFGLSAEAGL